MNEKAKAISTASLAGLFALFALHGEAFFRGAMGAWHFMEAITGSASLGVGAFFWGIGFSTLVNLALRTWVPRGRNEHTRGVLADFLGLVIAVHVAWLQVPGRNGIMVGLLAGLAAPLLTRVILALATWAGFVREDRAMPAPPAAAAPPIEGEDPDK